jgi:glycine/D-amino acid oxidase-like deaminating enzyme
VISDATPIRFPGPPPVAADVVIVGGGVIGVCTALFLAEAGVKVVLCEKGRIAGEQSSRNWGWIRRQGRDPAELPVMAESLTLWRGFADRLGEGLGFRQAGVLYLAEKAAEMADFEAWLPHGLVNGTGSALLTAAAVRRLVPGGHWAGALWTPGDARAEPWAAVPMLAGLAAAAGAVLVEGCAVRTLDLAAGRVAGVVTEAGRIAAERVVVAGGAWSRLLLGAHGVRIPQLSVRASVAATVPLPEVFAGNAADATFAFRRRQDGGYTLAPKAAHDFFVGPDAVRSFGAYLPVLRKDFRSTAFHAAAPRGFPDAWRTPRRWTADRPSPFEAVRVLNPAPNLRTLSAVQDAFARAFPTLGRPALRATWAGMIDTMPDVVPVVDHGPVPGLTVATGMSGHGFGIGPGFGRVVADLVRGRAPGHDLSRFRFARFSDGSRLAPGPSL